MSMPGSKNPARPACDALTSTPWPIRMFRCNCLRIQLNTVATILLDLREIEFLGNSVGHPTQPLNLLVCCRHRQLLQSNLTRGQFILIGVCFQYFLKTNK